MNFPQSPSKRRDTDSTVCWMSAVPFKESSAESTVDIHCDLQKSSYNFPAILSYYAVWNSVQRYFMIVDPNQADKPY